MQNLKEGFLAFLKFKSKYSKKRNRIDLEQLNQIKLCPPKRREASFLNYGYLLKTFLN